MIRANHGPPTCDGPMRIADQNRTTTRFVPARRDSLVVGRVASREKNPSSAPVTVQIVGSYEPNTREISERAYSILRRWMASDVRN